MYQLQNLPFDASILELTSLSANPDSSIISLSRATAYLAEILIERGFARHIDTCVRMIVWLGSVPFAIIIISGFLIASSVKQFSAFA